MDNSDSSLHLKALEGEWLGMTPLRGKRPRIKSLQNV